jgi:hypothetical protein
VLLAANREGSDPPLVANAATQTKTSTSKALSVRSDGSQLGVALCIQFGLNSNRRGRGGGGGDEIHSDVNGTGEPERSRLDLAGLDMKSPAAGRSRHTPGPRIRHSMVIHGNRAEFWRCARLGITGVRPGPTSGTPTGSADVVRTACHVVAVTTTYPRRPANTLAWRRISVIPHPILNSLTEIWPCGAIYGPRAECRWLPSPTQIGRRRAGDSGSHGYLADRWSQASATTRNEWRGPAPRNTG